MMDTGIKEISFVTGIDRSRMEFTEALEDELAKLYSDDVIVYPFRLSDRTDTPADRDATRLRRRIDRKDYLFSDNDPEEASTDFFLTLSPNGDINTIELFNGPEAVNIALTAYEKSELADMALIRVEDGRF